MVCPCVPGFTHAVRELGIGRGIFVGAAQAVLDELVAVFEQVRVELAARPREIVQVVEVEEASELRDYAVMSIRVSTRQSARWCLRVEQAHG